MYEITETEEIERAPNEGMKFLRSLSKLQRLKLLTLVQTNPSFKRAFMEKYNQTEPFNNEIDSKLFGEIPQHLVLQFWGETGSGKSTTGRTVAYERMARKRKNKVHICMEQRQLLLKAKQLRRSKFGHILILDEQPRQFGVGSVRESLEVVNIEEVTRKFRLSLVFISPTIRVHQAAHYWLKTIIMDTKRRVNRLAIQDPSSKMCLGFIEVKIPKTDPLEADYEKEKDLFIQRAMRGQLRSGYLAVYAKEILKDKRINEVKNKKQIELLIMEKFPSLSRGEVSYVVEYIKIISRKRKK